MNFSSSSKFSQATVDLLTIDLTKSDFSVSYREPIDLTDIHNTDFSQQKKGFKKDFKKENLQGKSNSIPLIDLTSDDQSDQFSIKVENSCVIDCKNTIISIESGTPNSHQSFNMVKANNRSAKRKITSDFKDSVKNVKTLFCYNFTKESPPVKSLPSSQLSYSVEESFDINKLTRTPNQFTVDENDPLKSNVVSSSSQEKFIASNSSDLIMDISPLHKRNATTIVLSNIVESLNDSSKFENKPIIVSKNKKAIKNKIPLPIIDKKIENNVIPEVGKLSMNKLITNLLNETKELVFRASKTLRINIIPNLKSNNSKTFNRLEIQYKHLSPGSDVTYLYILKKMQSSFMNVHSSISHGMFLVATNNLIKYYTINYLQYSCIIY